MPPFKKFLSFTHPHAVQDAYDFISSEENKQKTNLSLRVYTFKKNAGFYVWVKYGQILN